MKRAQKLRETNARQLDFARRIEVLNQTVAALDARIRENFVAIYEAMGMTATMTPSDPRKDGRMH